MMFIPLFLLCCVVAPTRETPSGLRFRPCSAPFAYGLDVVPPWPDGGYLTINLPEHLEYEARGMGILRYSDKEPHARWEVSPDGQTASLDASSPAAAGVHVTGLARVVGENRIEISIRITNGGQIRLADVKPLYCHHYRSLTGFPQYRDNFAHTFVILGGKPAALSNVPTQRADTTVKGAPVIGCPQRGDYFAEEHGGYIDQGIDAAIAAVTSLDGRRKMIVSWTPGKSMLSNAAIPCIHADPYYGTIEPGQSREAKGIILFTEGSLEDAMRELRRSGAGKAGGKAP